MAWAVVLMFAAMVLAAGQAETEQTVRAMPSDTLVVHGQARAVADDHSIRLRPACEDAPVVYRNLTVPGERADHWLPDGRPCRPRREVRP